MPLRTLALLLVSLLPSLAQDPSVAFPLGTSGGRWTGYEPAGPSPNFIYSELRKRGDVLQTSGTHTFSVDRLTGAVNRSPRPGFPSAQEDLICDGDSPVFWTRPSGEDPARPYFLRDWTTGDKTGEVVLPAGFAPSYIDSHGTVALTGLAIRATDPAGGTARDATFAALGISGYDFKVTGCQDWLALSYRKTGGDRLAILDRATLAFAGDHPLAGDQITMDGNLLAARINSPWGAEHAMLYQLPALTPITGLPNQSPTQDGVRQLKLADGNLWVLQQISDQDGCAFLQYDLSALPAVRLRQRVAPPGQVLPTISDILPMVATGNYLGVVDAVGTLWIWNREPANDPYQPLLKLEAWQEGREGGNALARLSLSDPVAWPVQVALSARSGSAVEGSDFAAWSRTVTIPAGETYALAEVPLLADTTLEENETFEVVVGQVTGALAENESASLVISGNGYNLEHNGTPLAGGKLRWTHIYGSDGRVLVGLAAVVTPTAGLVEGLVIADMETGNVIGNRAGTSWAPNSWKCEFRDNLVVLVAYGFFEAYRTDTGAEVAKWAFWDSELIGMVDATRMLVKQNTTQVALRQVSDGAVLATAPFAEDASITLSEDARDGTPSSIYVYRHGRAAGERLSFNRLSELNRDTLAATELSSWRSFRQPGGDYAKILAVWQDKLLLSAERGLTAVNRQTGAPLWHLPSTLNGTTLYGHGMVGNVMALTGLFTGPDQSSSFIRFIDMDRGAEIETYTPQQFVTDGQWWGAAISAFDDGWMLTSRGSSFRVLKTPVRPNVKIIAPVIEENIPATLQAVPREGFTGTYPVRISEFVHLGEDRPVADRLLSGLPVDLQVDSDGVDFTVAATRSVNSLENTWLRATAPGRKTLLSGAPLKTVVDTHVVTVPNGAFTTGTPVRSTRARSVAASEPLLAVGYPLEPTSDGLRQGVVDIYNRHTGAFLRTLDAPVGTEGKRFGHAVGAAGNKIIVGAPGQRTVGRVFAYDGTTGSLIQELMLKGKSGEFGSAITVNDRWIAISATGLPSQPKPGTAPKITGIVMVFDAVTLKAVMTKSAKGEGFGTSIALSGDKLFVSSPGAPYKKMYSVGMVRGFSIPKGKQLGIIMAREPEALQSFGHYLDASDSKLVIGGVFDPVIDTAALQAHSTSNFGFLGYYSMPGDTFSYSRVKAHGDWMIGGGLTLRFFREESFRPTASRKIANDPGFPIGWPSPYYFWESNLATYGDLLYWADYAPKIMAMPDPPAAAALRSALVADANGDGLTNELDRLYLHRGDAGLPARATLRETADGSLNFLLQADPDIPEGMDLWFEISADLNRWEPVLHWRHDAPGWRDDSGALLEVSPDGRVNLEHRSEAGRVFFRTRAAGR